MSLRDWHNFAGGLEAMRVMCAEIRLPYYWALLAETFGRAGPGWRGPGRVVKELDLIESNHGSAAEHAGAGKDPKGRNPTLHLPELVCNVFLKAGRSAIASSRNSAPNASSQEPDRRCRDRLGG